MSGEGDDLQEQHQERLRLLGLCALWVLGVGATTSWGAHQLEVSLQHDVAAALEASGLSHLGVSVHQRDVWLIGAVPDPMTQARARIAAAGVPGVHRVDATALVIEGGARR